MFRLKVALTNAEIDELRPVWDSLGSYAGSMFQSYLWNRIAANVFAAREQPYFVLAENDNGAAILPAVIDVKSKTIGFAGERLFDYRDYLSSGDSGALLRAWRRLGTLRLPLSITAITRPDDEGWNRLRGTHFSTAPKLLSSAMSSENFAAAHGRAFSRLRKLERMGLHIRGYPGSSPIVRQIYERRAQQLGDHELFRDPMRVEFMVTVCREAGSACEIFALEHGASTMAAALVTFRDRDFRRFYTIYHDQRWARYSPGVSLLFEIVRRTLEQGLSCDLMTGEQAYKMRIASTAQELFQVKATAAELRKAFPEEVAEVAA